MKIFLVHGSNKEYLTLVKDFLKENGHTPYILSNKPNEGQTIIEKLETNADKVDCAIVLMTADDKGRQPLKRKLENRSRQNVVFEFGLFIGKLGRKKVICLYEESVKKPSDLEGHAHIVLNADMAWKNQLLKELKSIPGYYTDSIEKNSLNTPLRRESNKPIIGYFKPLKRG